MRSGHSKLPHQPTAPAGLQFLLPATWTALSSAGGVNFNHLAALLAEQPAKLAGLSHRKGKIAKGYDADIVVSADMSSHSKWCSCEAGIIVSAE
jgi:dihydroorotase-like cyclic amidohydrolase